MAQSPLTGAAHLGSLEQAETAFRKAKEIQAQAAARMAQVAARTEGALHRPRLSWGRPGESNASRLIGQLQTPQGAQQAILASIVLGPPRALDSQDPLPGTAPVI
jgi:hypothetical protein